MFWDEKAECMNKEEKEKVISIIKTKLMDLQWTR